MYSFNLYPLITKPTRVCETNATIIDNIFHNNIVNNNLTSGIFYTDISDHFPVFTIDVSKKCNIMPKTVIYRDYSERNKTMFADLLLNKDWSTLLNDYNSHSAFLAFHTDFSQLYNTSFPVKHKISNYNTKLPWLTNAL